MRFGNSSDKMWTFVNCGLHTQGGPIMLSTSIGSNIVDQIESNESKNSEPSRRADRENIFSTQPVN